MANIYDMNAAIGQPNIMGNFQQGVQYGQAQRKLKEQRLDQQNLRNLAPAIMGGDPNAYEQAAVIDPKAAQGYQEASDSQFRRLKGMVDFVNKRRALAIEKGDSRYLDAALKEVGPYISKLTGGKPPPTTWTPDMDEGWAQLEARVAMADQKDAAGKGVLSTYIDDQGRRVAVNRDGTTSVLGGADQGMSQQTITITGPDGRPAQYTFNKRTGAYEPATLGAAGQVPPQADSFVPGEDGSPIPMQTIRGADGQIYRVQAGDPNAAQAGAADMGAGGQASSVQFPQRDVSPAQRSGASPFVGRSKEEEAAAVEAAKQQAQLAFLPQELNLRTQADIEKTTGVEAAKNQAERSAKQAEKNATFQVYEAAMEGLTEGLTNTDTGPVMGRIPAVTAGQQTAEGAVAALAPVLKSLFRTAGEGTFTDKDQDLLLRMVPTRTDLPAAREAKLANIDRIVRAKLGIGAASAGGPSEVARPVSQADFDALPNGATYIDPDDGRTYRKP